MIISLVEVQIASLSVLSTVFNSKIKQYIFKKKLSCLINKQPTANLALQEKFSKQVTRRRIADKI